MAMGDYFTIIPKKVWQLTGNKERETGGGGMIAYILRRHSIFFF